MGPAAYALDDRVGCSLQFIIKAAFDQTAEPRFPGIIAMKGESGHIGLTSGAGHCPVHGLDDIAANAEVAQGRLQTRLERPAGYPDLSGKPQPFELGALFVAGNALQRGVQFIEPQPHYTAAPSCGTAIGLSPFAQSRCISRSYLVSS